MESQEAIARGNYDWFQDHLPELEKQYGDKYLVIKDKSVIGAYPSYSDAYGSVKGKEKPGTYIIQLCSSDEEKTLNVFHSRVSFN
jgi:hypothetical protein